MIFLQTYIKIWNLFIFTKYLFVFFLIHSGFFGSAFLVETQLQKKDWICLETNPILKN